MAVQFVHLLLIQAQEVAEARAPRIHERRRNPFEELSDVNFIKMFRLSKELANFLIEELTPYLRAPKRDIDIDIRSKVLIALRFYAAGSYQMDVGSNKYFCVTQPTVSRCLKEVTNALNNPLIFNRFVKFPSTIRELNVLRTNFYRQYQFPGIIGIIDCTHIAIVPPNENDLNHPEHVYVNRKHYHSLNVQLICDNNLKILNVNAAFPGSTHDAFIWQASNVSRILQRLFQNGYRGYYLFGDSGYPLRPWLMIPLNHQPPHGTPEHRYNSRFKTIRSSIERCNGVLKKRIRCLLKDRVLHYTPGVAGRIVNACVVLHNLCIDHRIPDIFDEDLPIDADYGIYDAQNENNNEQDGGVARRVNPDLEEARNIRSRIIRALN